MLDVKLLFSPLFSPSFTSHGALLVLELPQRDSLLLARTHSLPADPLRGHLQVNLTCPKPVKLIPFVTCLNWFKVCFCVCVCLPGRDTSSTSPSRATSSHQEPRPPSRAQHRQTHLSRFSPLYSTARSESLDLDLFSKCCGSKFCKNFLPQIHFPTGLAETPPLPPPKVFI